MKTIELQKSTDINYLSVYINGEKHIMRHQSLKVEVADNKPFEIRVRQGWDGSQKYTFEPKDEMVLQITTMNRNLFIYLPIVLYALASFVVRPVFGKSASFIFFFSAFLLLIIFYLVIRKKILAIQEVNDEK